MRNIITKIMIVSALFALSCEDEVPVDVRELFLKPIDPNTELSKLSRNLIVEGTNKEGIAPSSNSEDKVRIVFSQESASVSQGTDLFIPFIYDSETEVTGAYLQIEDADNYWDIPIQANSSSNGYTLNIGLPDKVLEGDFDITYKLHDQQGNIGNEKTVNARVEDPLENCGQNGQFPRIEGKDGIFTQAYNLGENAGQVSISYYMYTLKDRIDIRYGDKWVYSSGQLLDNSRTGVPPAKDCNQAGNNDGYVSGGGGYILDYDPVVSKELVIYVSGCLNSTTEWCFDVSCVESEITEEPKPKFYEGLPDCPCNYDATIDGKTTSEPKGKWVDYGAADQRFHFGASYEIRWEPDESGSGQQCTYDENKNLITSGIAAGTPDKSAPSGVFNISIDTWNHYREDVLKWISVPCNEYLEKWPPNQGDENSCVTSAPNPVTDYTQNEVSNKTAGNLTCDDITELYKQVAGSNNEDLMCWFNSNGNNCSMGITEVISELEELKSKACKPIPTRGSHLTDEKACLALDKAIKNLGG